MADIWLTNASWFRDARFFTFFDVLHVNHLDVISSIFHQFGSGLNTCQPFLKCVDADVVFVPDDLRNNNGGFRVSSQRPQCGLDGVREAPGLLDDVSREIISPECGERLDSKSVGISIATEVGRIRGVIRGIRGV